MLILSINAFSLDYGLYPNECTEPIYSPSDEIDIYGDEKICFNRTVICEDSVGDREFSLTDRNLRDYFLGIKGEELKKVSLISVTMELRALHEELGRYEVLESQKKVIDIKKNSKTEIKIPLSIFSKEIEGKENSFIRHLLVEFEGVTNEFFLGETCSGKLELMEKQNVVDAGKGNLGFKKVKIENKEFIQYPKEIPVLLSVYAGSEFYEISYKENKCFAKEFIGKSTQLFANKLYRLDQSEFSKLIHEKDGTFFIDASKVIDSFEHKEGLVRKIHFEIREASSSKKRQEITYQPKELENCEIVKYEEPKPKYYEEKIFEVVYCRKIDDKCVKPSSLHTYPIYGKNLEVETSKEGKEFKVSSIAIEGGYVRSIKFFDTVFIGKDNIQVTLEGHVTDCCVESIHRGIKYEALEPLKKQFNIKKDKKEDFVKIEFTKDNFPEQYSKNFCTFDIKSENSEYQLFIYSNGGRDAMSEFMHYWRHNCKKCSPEEIFEN